MAELAKRLVVEHVAHLKATAAVMVARDRMTSEDITAILERFKEIGLIHLGRLRAAWLMHDKPYHPDVPLARELIADLVLAAASIARVTGAIAVCFDDGIVEFRRGDRVVSSHLFISGRGSRTRTAIEGELSVGKRRFQGRAVPPTGAVIAGTRDNIAPVTTPPDVVIGDASESIVFGSTSP